MPRRPVDLLPYVEFTQNGNPRRIYADAWESEDLQIAAEATEHALENGARVSDHYRILPKVAKARLFFSSAPTRGDLNPGSPGQVRSRAMPAHEYPKLTPLLSPGGLTGAAKEGINAVASLVGLGPDAGPKGWSALMFDRSPNRLRVVLLQLIELVENSKLVTVGLSVLRIPNVAILNIGLARSADDGADGAIDLEFRQLNFTSAKTAAAIPVPLEPRGQTKGDSITVAAAPPPEGAESSAVGALLPGIAK